MAWKGIDIYEIVSERRGEEEVEMVGWMEEEVGRVLRRRERLGRGESSKSVGGVRWGLVGEVGDLETAAGGYRGIKKGRAEELGLYDYGVADVGESRGRRCDFQWWRKEEASLRIESLTQWMLSREKRRQCCLRGIGNCAQL